MAGLLSLTASCIWLHFKFLCHKAQLRAYRIRQGDLSEIFTPYFASLAHQERLCY